MSASLVGSEMCIRDRLPSFVPLAGATSTPRSTTASYARAPCGLLGPAAAGVALPAWKTCSPRTRRAGLRGCETPTGRTS
eukprot:14850651-Alexandrium_andersonii.AAC.1